MLFSSEDRLHLVSELFPPIPIDTTKAARAVLDRSNFYLAIGDLGNELFSGLDLIDQDGKPVDLNFENALLYLVTIFQHLENLPDQLAVVALENRVDWKYALHLPLHYLGIPESSLCNFRKFLLHNTISLDHLQTLLSRLSLQIESKPKSSELSNARYLLYNLCMLNRLEKTWNSIQKALVALGNEHAEWLRSIYLPHWHQRYGPPQNTFHPAMRMKDRELLAQVIGEDGFYLLKMASNTKDSELRKILEVEQLQMILDEQYEWVNGILIWTSGACPGCSLRDKFTVQFN